MKQYNNNITHSMKIPLSVYKGYYIYLQGIQRLHIIAIRLLLSVILNFIVPLAM